MECNDKIKRGGGELQYFRNISRPRLFFYSVLGIYFRKSYHERTKRGGAIFRIDRIPAVSIANLEFRGAASKMCIFLLEAARPQPH